MSTAPNITPPAAAGKPPETAHDAVIANRWHALSGEVGGYDIVDDLFDLLNDGEPEHYAFAALESAALILRAPNVSQDEVSRLATSAIELAWRMLRVVDMMDAAQTAADYTFLKTQALVTPEELARMLSDARAQGVKDYSERLLEEYGPELFAAMEKKKAEQAPPKSRRVISSEPPKSQIARQKKHLRVISSSPKSRRAPASSKPKSGGRRAA